MRKHIRSNHLLLKYRYAAYLENICNYFFFFSITRIHSCVNGKACSNNQLRIQIIYNLY